MPKKALPSVSTLRQLVEYEIHTGRLLWKPRSRSFFQSYVSYERWNSTHANTPAFTTLHHEGHYCGGFDGQVLGAHRVAWAIHHGAWPEKQIHHINGVRTDNRLSNLREGANSDAPKRRGLYRNNTTGYNGVTWVSSKNKYLASIMGPEKRICLGHFDTLEDAVAARRAADRVHGYHPDHGRKR